MDTAKINKYLEYGTTKMKVLYKEKKFDSNGYQLKYILEKNRDSDDLIVIFSGIPRPGLKARYNYNRTLKDVKANRLFILDDFGYDERGSYYLGKDKDFKIQLAVKDLIEAMKSDLSTKNTIYTGSSKGGYAAMYFGIQDNNSTIIAGSLQHLLGNYITSNERMSTNLMSYVMGKEYNQDDINYLNILLKDTINEHKQNTCDIYLHYSDSEYTYKDHMVHLLTDLNDCGIVYQEDIAHYKGHDELALYFPPFLVKTVNHVLEEGRK